MNTQPEALRLADDLHKAARQALEALEAGLDVNPILAGEAEEALRAALAQQAEPDLSLCPQCNGPADNGHDRSIPPHPYLCTKCMAELPQPSYNVTVVDDAHPNGIPLEQWQNKPAAWRCACGANLFIDADGAPRSKAEPVQEPQTLDAAMQQPCAMAQAYENGYKAGAAAEREACAKLAEATICDTHLPTGVRIYGTRVADAIRARGSA
jgi:hypothetical protein